jgi:sugar phosphate permease
VEVSSVFVPALVVGFGWSRTLIASATTLGSVASALLGPLIGRVLDRHGPRLMVPAGTLVVGVGCLTLARTSSIAVFVVVYALVRMASQSMVQFAATVTVARWFGRRRGAATALLFGISASGLVIAPPVVQVIIARGGVEPAWTALGMLALLLGVAPAALLLARGPEDLGVLPDAETPARRSMAAPKPGSDDRMEGYSLGEATTGPTLWLIVGATFSVSLVMTGVGFHQLAYYVERGISPFGAALVVSSFALGLTVGGVLWSWLADRLDARWLLTGVSVAAALSLGLLLAVRGPEQAFPFGFAFGMLVGGSMSLPTLLLAGYYGRGSLGVIAGVLHMARGFGLGLGPLVTGVFYDVSGRYEPAFQTFIAVCIGSALLMAFARRPARR